ncbi:hypothetical protein LTR50_006914 [Elasticomyces elasticus]|nr:hypothetical protein LTR50_006914 [Elasticomyces elasticus]
MDVDKTSFQPLLLELLTDISEAHFVAFDLELSGIAAKQASGNGKPTLQQRYEETRDAANDYTILQLGLTCVIEDLEHDTYVLKPYNIYVNPAIDERVDIERSFAFQSGAVHFLLKNGFQIELPFTRGVTYLSRDEAKRAKDKAYSRLNTSHIADIQASRTPSGLQQPPTRPPSHKTQLRAHLGSLGEAIQILISLLWTEVLLVANYALQLGTKDLQSLAFTQHVRTEINGWLETGKPFPEYHNIASVGQNTKSDSAVPAELSRFEKRLVHQLVRAEYPDLVTVSRRAFIQVVKFDKEREDLIVAEKKKQAKARILGAVGLRWVIEALCGGELRKIDIKSFARDPRTGESAYADLDDYKARFDRAQARLKTKRPVLIGHNCFTDLLYLYRTFIGELPATVEEHQRNIHDLFPVVVDTKYLATHNCGDINPASSLEEIAKQMQERDFPLLETHAGHDKYLETSAFHEAGYDSFLTAQVAVRLSAKLEAAGSYIEAPHSAPSPTKVTEGNESANDPPTSTSPAHSSPDQGGVSLLASISDGVKNLLQAPVQAVAGASGEAPPAKPKKKAASRKRGKKKKSGGVVPASSPSSSRSRFTSANPFDRLSEDVGSAAAADLNPVADTDGAEPAEELELGSSVRWRHESAEGVAPPAAAAHGRPRRAKKAKGEEWGCEIARVPGGSMPPFGTDFWRVYGNRLRVFGTLEGVCELGPGA